MDNFKQCLDDCKAHDDCPGKVNCLHGFCADGASDDADPTPRHGKRLSYRLLYYHCNG